MEHPQGGPNTSGAKTKPYNTSQAIHIQHITYWDKFRQIDLQSRGSFKTNENTSKVHTIIWCNPIEDKGNIQK
jgi:hypothetical protein